LRHPIRDDDEEHVLYAADTHPPSVDRGVSQISWVASLGT
jgi:hypothetical protein